MFPSSTYLEYSRRTICSDVKRIFSSLSHQAMKRLATSPAIDTPVAPPCSCLKHSFLNVYIWLFITSFKATSNALISSFLFTSSVPLRNGLVQLFQRFSYSVCLPLLVIVGGRPELFRVGQKSKRFSFSSSFFFTVSDR